LLLVFADDRFKCIAPNEHTLDAAVLKQAYQQSTGTATDTSQLVANLAVNGYDPENFWTFGQDGEDFKCILRHNITNHPIRQPHHSTVAYA